MAIGTLITVGVAVALTAIGIMFYVISIYNSLISLKNNIRKSWANIDVLLKQRNDEVPRLIECVKGYMKHEREILTMLAESRERLMKASTIPQKATTSMEITNALKSIFALVENYPNLKASDNFIQLQNRISGLENEIADRREFYNDSVNLFNIRIESIPSVYIARLLGYKREDMFEASEEEKKNVNTKV